MTLLLSVDTVLTHDLLSEWLTPATLARILPSSYNGDTTSFRTEALTRVVKLLLNRTPPIRQGDLADVTELRDAVKYYAAEMLYQRAITSLDSPHAIQARYYAGLASDEMRGLTPTLLGDVRGAAGSWSSERR